MAKALPMQVVNLGQRQSAKTMGQMPAPPIAGFIPSPITGALIPVFLVELTHRGRTEQIQVGFDTGMSGAHLEIPTSTANKLGLTAIDTEEFIDASGVHLSSVAHIDKISLPGKSGCFVPRAKVIFHDGAPTLIGNDFIRDIGGSIRYGSKGASLTCTGGIAEPGLHLPKFRISIVHRNKVLNVDALFDTGWETADVAMPASMADQLGLSIIGQKTASTHTGNVTLYQAKADKVGLSDLSQCFVNDAVVSIYPRGSSWDDLGHVVVGEPFFKRTGGTLGYDSDGAFFGCRASSGRVRAIETEWVPIDYLVSTVMGVPAVVWIAGGLLVVVGLGVLIGRNV
jgi:predicted aspartyl protease